MSKNWMCVEDPFLQIRSQIKICKALGEKNLIIRNGKIVQYEQRRFNTRVLTNNLTVTSETRDAHPPSAVPESLDSVAVNKITTDSSATVPKPAMEVDTLVESLADDHNQIS